MPKLPENNKFDICMQYPKKEVTDEADFIHADKHEWFLQIDAMILMGMVEHSQSSESNKFASSKVKMIKIKVSCKLISTLWTWKFPTRWYYHYWWPWSRVLKVLKVALSLALSFLKEVARHVQSTPYRKLVIVLQYIKKKVLQLLLYSTVMQNIQIYDDPVKFVFTCFS